jgi:hypothetical protein
MDFFAGYIFEIEDVLKPSESKLKFQDAMDMLLIKYTMNVDLDR